jgi:flavin reductase (DIM6/NTAB) family NADH-FMN oxidoreductase RutF
MAASQPPRPPEFALPLPEVAVWAGPAGIGDAPFEDLVEPEAVDLPVELGDDPAVALRKTLGLFATGVTIVTTLAGERVHGMTANAFMSVSLEPPLVLISVDRRTTMCQLLHQGRRYGVSVLHEDQSALSDRFAGRAVDGEAEEARFLIVRDTPVVDGALAQFVARVEQSYWGGDHSLFLGRVESARYRAGAPLLFHGGRYGRLEP